MKTPSNHPSSRNEARSHPPGIEVKPAMVMAIIAVLLALAIGLMSLAFWIGTRPVEGELVFSETGCKALEHHGATVAQWAGESGCAIEASFRINTRAKTVRLEVSTDKGPIEVVLSSRELISHAYR